MLTHCIQIEGVDTVYNTVFRQRVLTQCIQTEVVDTVYSDRGC